MEIFHYIKNKITKSSLWLDLKEVTKDQFDLNKDSKILAQICKLFKEEDLQEFSRFIHKKIHSKKWIRVFRTLSLCEYLLKNGDAPITKRIIEERLRFENIVEHYYGDAYDKSNCEYKFIFLPLFYLCHV